ncbi:MAG: Gfo/Idh/MocA family oxidoreductase [Endomicrobium sp.]|jgi:predicted dehydrogenase|nr:Gfo/Idh/MocA family oxidoreductase [Endomicrobium sp.]
MSIRTAVIGVGALGQHHARILKQHCNSILKFVVDIDEKRAKTIAKLNRTEYLTDFNKLVGNIDAAVIATPTQYHYRVAKQLLCAGVHCLVEKPFTLSIIEAEELIKISKNKNLILQIGHVERFNPAVIVASSFINNPKFIEINRLGSYDCSRTNNVGVVLDLMIHDLDILSFFLRSKVTFFEAHGAKVFSDTEDIAKVRLKYTNGCIADVSASRISIEKYRKIRIFQPDSYISIDYAKKSLKVYKKRNTNKRITSFRDISFENPKLPSNEPLFYELDNFINSVIKGKKPYVSGEQGKNSVELALNILQNMVF